MVTTVVTSDFLAEVARAHGLEVMWTLTGFKYIAICMDALEARGETYAFGAEESFGMQLSNEMRDKDGVLAALVVGEMVGHYKALGMGPFQAVAALERRVGVFRNRLVNLEDPRPGGAVRFAEAMTRIREAGLTAFAGEAVVVLGGFPDRRVARRRPGGADPGPPRQPRRGPAPGPLQRAQVPPVLRRLRRLPAQRHRAQTEGLPAEPHQRRSYWTSWRRRRGGCWGWADGFPFALRLASGSGFLRRPTGA